MSKPKIEEVYRCPECDAVFDDPNSAANCCLVLPPLEYKCLACGFVWPKADQAIRCFDYEQSKAGAK